MVARASVSNLQEAFLGGNEIDSTTRGIGIPDMTTAQRDAIINPTLGEMVFATDLSGGQMSQWNGSAWTIPGGGLTTLQNAYDNSLGANPMITLNNTPTPISIQASVAGSVFEVRDVGAANTIFEIQADADTITARAGVTVDNAYANATAAASIILTDTVTVPAFVGGGIQSLGTVTYSSGTFIWALLQESKGYIANAGPGFAAFTLFNAIPFIRNGTNAGLVQALTLNVGISHQSNGAVAVTTVGTTGVSFSPNTRALSAFGSMTKTGGDTALRVSPTWGTVNLSSINFGTIRGVHCLAPAQALFQGSAGTEAMTAYIGMDIEAQTFGGNVTKRGVRSFLAAASNTRFLDGQGTAQSDLRGTLNFPVDLVGVQYGASLDYFQAWAAGGFFLEQFNASGDQLRWSNPGTNRYVLETENGNADGEFNLGFERFSFGQTGAVGNQVGNFVANARTIGVGGDWADFLLTQAGSLTVGGLAMGRVSAWVINGISYASSSGSVTNADTLTVGGFPTSSPGVTITNRHSLNVIGGRSRFASAIQLPPISPAALGAGNNNDWNGLLTGSINNNMRTWGRITGNATTSVLTGIDSSNAQSGDSFDLTNVGSETIVINNEDAASLAANRIITPTGRNFVLRENNTVTIRYDTADSRWRIVSAQVNSGTLSGEWQFDSTTTMADPGSGEFRNNNATIGSVTAIAISDTTKPGADAGGILAALANGDQLYLQNIEDSSEFLVFDITSNTDNTGWHQLGGTVNASGSNFTDGKEFLITAIFA